MSGQCSLASSDRTSEALTWCSGPLSSRHVLLGRRGRIAISSWSEVSFSSLSLLSKGEYFYRGSIEIGAYGQGRHKWTSGLAARTRSSVTYSITDSHAIVSL